MIALFPGQGSQQVGMGKDLVENFPIARQCFEEASDAIKVDLKKLCFNGPDEELKKTENTQPALLTTCTAAFLVLKKEFDFKPQVVAGHSLGEYTALVAAGAISFSDAVQWVKERGKAMQMAVPKGQGAMAAVLGVDDAIVIETCKSISEQQKRDANSNWDIPYVVEAVNFNAPGQVVIAGSLDAVQSFIASVTENPELKRAKCVLLPVSAPFHSSLMKNARDKMAELFSQASKPSSLLCPYIPNRTARLNQESSLIYDLLIEQVDHSVLWSKSMVELLNQGFETAIEFGPGQVLQGLMKRISRAEKKNFEVHHFDSKESLTLLRKVLS